MENLNLSHSLMELKLSESDRYSASVVFILTFFITRREPIASAKYWIHFIARFNSDQAFGSARSELIWMKFGEILNMLSAAGPGRFWA